MKLIVVLLIALWPSLYGYAQTTLERNINASYDQSSVAKQLEKVLFEYQPTSRDNVLGDIDKKTMSPNIDSSSLAIKRAAITTLENQYRATTSAALKAVIAKNLEIERLKQELDKKSFELLRERALTLQTKINALKDSLNDIDFNARRLSYFSWDIFNQIDSTKEIKNKETFFDSLTIFRSRFDRFYERNVYRDLDSIEKIDEDFSYLNSGTLSLKDTANITTISKKLTRLEEKYRTNKHQMEVYSNYWNDLVRRNIIKKEKEKKLEVTALPFFNSIPGLRDYNGTLSLFGNNRPKSKDGVYIEFGAYTGILGSADELSRYNLFIPEVSTFGFFFKNNFALKTASDSITRLGLNIGFYYLGKKVKADTIQETKPLTTSLFQLKFGLEYVLVKDLFSVYSNLNAQSFMTNRTNIKSSFNIQKSLIGTVDFGFRMLLNPTQNIKIDDWKLYFDLNFIVNNGDIREIGQSDDFVIPNFRVGLRKELGRQ